MDNETAKILILEKLFNELVPKIASYYLLFKEEDIDSFVWYPNYFYLEERLRESNPIVFGIKVTIDKFGQIEEINLTKTNHHEHPHQRRYRMLARAAVGGAVPVEPIPEPEVVEKKFSTKEEAIKTISKDVSLLFLTKVGMCAKKEINAYEDKNNAMIGSLKEILDLSPDINILNLETRRILTEIIK